jgi:deoxyribodipyrimidine photo-lyase
MVETMTKMIWFRNDLRTIDCEPLLEACREGKPVEACFLACPKQWEEHGLGANKIEYLRRSVVELGRRLDELKIPLHIRIVDTFAEVPDAMLELACGLKCKEIHWGREYEVNELDRDQATRRILESEGIAVHEYDDQVVIEPGFLKTGSGSPYKVFTPFKKSWLRAVEASEELEPRRRPTPRKRKAFKKAQVPSAFEGFESFVDIDEWPVGEVQALDHMEDFLHEHAGRYGEDRNIPSIDGTSRLGPALAVGALSPRTCIDAARRQARKSPTSAAGLEIWISEIAWRDFYRNVLFEFPRVCRNRAFKPATEAVAWRDDEDSFLAWCEGRTGYPIVDAAMRALVATGWMHNRLRMITSQFLSKHLLIDWRKGEAFFARHLVDMDFASNNGGWQWSSSTGTDSAPYFRVFNPTTQGRRFDMTGTFIRRWIPEIAQLSDKAIHEPSQSGEELWTQGPYPEPIVDQSFGRKRAISAFAEVTRS